jgi:hypothetical protein
MSGRLLIFVGALVAVLALTGTASARKVPGHYIVVVKQEFSAREVASDHGRRAGAEVLRTYRHALNGFSARLSDDALAKVRADSRVLLVSADHEVRAAGQTLPTGVNRIEGRERRGRRPRYGHRPHSS